MGFNFIVEKKARRAAFRKRSSGLLKKAEELSTLCGVDVCLFIVGDGAGAGAIDGVHWPTSRSELQRIVGLFHSSHNAMIKKKKKKKKGNKNQHPSASASASASHSPREMQGMPSLREDLKSAIAKVRERIDHLLLQREKEQLPSSSSAAAAAAAALQVQEGLDNSNSSSPQSLNLDHDSDGSGSGEGFDEGNISSSQSSNLESLNLGNHQPLPMPICSSSSSCTTCTDMLLGNRINDDNDFDFFSQLPALTGVEAEVADCTDEIACSSSSLDYTQSNSLCWSNLLNNAADEDPVAVTEPSNEFEMMQIASFFPCFLSAPDDAIATIPSTEIEMMDGFYF